jgi:hypothetical protein
VYLLKNKAKKERKMSARKKFPILDKEKRQKGDPGQSQEVLDGAPLQIPGSQE